MKDTGGRRISGGMIKLVFGAVVCVAAKASFGGGPAAKQAAAYWTGETNLVAAVCAYERLAAVENGEVITIHSETIDEMCTNYVAIIFYVLSPESCRGQLFRLRGLSGEPCFLPYEYMPGRLYYFPFRPDSTNKGKREKVDCVISKDDLIPSDLNAHWKLTVATVFGERYYPDKLSAREKLYDVECSYSAATNELSRLDTKIESCALDKKKRAKLKARRAELEMRRIPNLVKQKDELKKQIYFLERMGK